MAQLLRLAVSKQKRRYQKDGFDLDLAYITERIIAMGFPSEKMEGVFRNPMKEVQRFLETKHKDHYRVYNLCSERDYDHGKFHGRVACYPFDDHNAPEFTLIEEFCKDVDNWMSRSEKNIAVIHCKAGKGRTGLMICCWLLYCRMWTDTESSLKFYAALRTYNQKGVTIPSQIRYVHYFGRFVQASGNHQLHRPLTLGKIVLKPLPNEINLSDINFNICLLKKTIFNSKDDHFNITIQRMDHKKKRRVLFKKDKTPAPQQNTTVSPPSSPSAKSYSTVGRSAGTSAMLKQMEANPYGTVSNFDYKTYYENEIVGKKENDEDNDDYVSFEFTKVDVNGDVRIEICNKEDRMFMFWINTSFVAQHEVITKTGLDKAHKDKKHKSYSENFRVELFFQDPNDPSGGSSSSSNNNTNVISSSTSPSGGASIPLASSMVTNNSPASKKLTRIPLHQSAFMMGLQQQAQQQQQPQPEQQQQPVEETDSI
ncbi:hypothetical protein SAMD00019534_000240, partial [Acytostelium subglobosum LB1]|uniref:hypothetical protein n=1 Tax=Acytostelium subglobosum LB1 TaxID=1410327 RepID=UPI000644F3C1